MGELFGSLGIWIMGIIGLGLLVYCWQEEKKHCVILGTLISFIAFYLQSTNVLKLPFKINPLAAIVIFTAVIFFAEKAFEVNEDLATTQKIEEQKKAREAAIEAKKKAYEDIQDFKSYFEGLSEAEKNKIIASKDLLSEENQEIIKPYEDDYHKRQEAKRKEAQERYQKQEEERKKAEALQRARQRIAYLLPNYMILNEKELQELFELYDLMTEEEKEKFEGFVKMTYDAIIKKEEEEFEEHREEFEKAQKAKELEKKRLETAELCKDLIADYMNLPLDKQEELASRYPDMPHETKADYQEAVAYYCKVLASMDSFSAKDRQIFADHEKAALDEARKERARIAYSETMDEDSEELKKAQIRSKLISKQI